MRLSPKTNETNDEYYETIMRLMRLLLELLGILLGISPGLYWDLLGTLPGIVLREYY